MTLLSENHAPDDGAPDVPVPAGPSEPLITVVCVYNDVEVRQRCLDSSLEAYGGAVSVEYLPIDNTSHAYSSAGAALNHGARSARGKVIVFVHQDVYLHSIDRLATAAGLVSAGWSVLGANGVSRTGESIGRLRDRVELIGSSAVSPREVDTLDEVLFMVAREQVVAEPLSEDPDLAWHAYAVEYGLRMQVAGRRVGAMDMAITHNSLTINLARLDVAHQRVGNLYPSRLPIRTTCGTIGSAISRWRNLPVLRQHRWRVRWVRQSLLANRARRRILGPVVIGDIGREVDLLEFSELNPLHVFNLDRAGGFTDHSDGRFIGTRFGKPVVMSVVHTVPELVAAVGALSPTTGVLVTDLADDDLAAVGTGTTNRKWIAGVQLDTRWLVSGSIIDQPPARWSEPKAVPMRLIHRRKGY